MLTAGTWLGPYEITGSLGAGAMGEVYRARDTKLHRDVAIKVLPELFARDPERLARFTREAQSLAALNHANIAQVFGVLDEPAAVVMEFVDGEDLAHRLERGAVPVDDAIPIALQIACGLEAAHERAIVHRDLKPANVRITPDGSVKILDSGLAKAIDPAAGSGAAAALNSPTFTSPATQMGMIIGTAAYMAPEQARGKRVDKRADIWAFGVVLYEMLAGKRPFGGETITDALAAIVKEDPDWTALPSSTPSSLRRLIAQCLVKDAKQRLRDIGDARIVIERIVAGSAEERIAAPSGPAAATGRRFGLTHLVAAALSLALVASLVTWWIGRPAAPATAALVRFVTPLPPEAAPVRTNGGGVAMVSAQGFVPDVWIVDLERGTRLKLSSRYGLYPVWSSDGSRIAFADRDKGILSVAADASGIPEVLMARDARQLVTPTAWAADGTIVFTVEERGSARGARNRDIWLARRGEKPRPLLQSGADEQEGAVSPDGQWLAYTSSASGRNEIYVRPFDGTGGTIPISSDGGASPVWTRKGDALYFTSGSRLMRAPAGGSPLQLGAPVVAQTLPPGTIGLDVAPDGRVRVVIRQDNADSRDFLHVLLNWSRTLR